VKFVINCTNCTHLHWNLCFGICFGACGKCAGSCPIEIRVQVNFSWRPPTQPQTISATYNQPRVHASVYVPMVQPRLPLSTSRPRTSPHIGTRPMHGLAYRGVVKWRRQWRWRVAARPADQTSDARYKISIWQCAKVVHTASRVLGLIRGTFRNFSREVVIKLYKSLIRPHLEYAVQAWRSHLRRDIDLIEGVQRRATKLLVDLKDKCYEDRLRSLKIANPWDSEIEGRYDRGFQNFESFWGCGLNFTFSPEHICQREGMIWN
jgi:ferredoxin